MNIDLIEQEPLDEYNAVMTKVVLSQVESQCILARLAIKALGRPGLDTDLEFVGSGEHWVLMWTYPALTLEATRVLVAGMLQST
jgi:hypothetical protein